MDKRVERIFKLEIAQQCTFAIMAEQDLIQCLQILFYPIGQVPPESIESHFQQISAARDGFWYTIHALLSATANISKILWPNPRDDRDQEDARELREDLHIDDTLPLANRRMRNHFEHIDTRIERFAQQKVHYIDTNIGHKAINVNGQPAVYMRNFDPEEYAVTYQNETLLLKSLMEAVVELRSRVQLFGCKT